MQHRAGWRLLDGQACPELQQREFAKLGAYAAAVADALRQRGVGEPAATLAADAGIAILRVSVDPWATRADDRELTAIVADAVRELRTLAAGT